VKDNDEYLEFAKSLAEDAGRIMKKYFLAEEMGLEIKSDNSPVTQADTEINELVVQWVKSRYPDHGVMGEEDSFGLDKDVMWIVDPLDGTYSFAIGIPPFAFSAALVEDGQLRVGVVYDPITKRLLWATIGQGAFENGKKLDITDKNLTDNLLISSWVVGGIENSIFSDKSVHGETAGAYAQTGRIDEIDLPIAYGLAITGSGRVDGLVSSIKTPWDVAAGSLIAMEAGAKVTDLFGNAVKRWDKEANGILAAAPKLHAYLSETIKSVLESAKNENNRH